MIRRNYTAGNGLYYLIWGMLAALMILLFILFPYRVNEDVALFLNMGKLLLRGFVPYVDYIETNPPLAQYLHAIPAYISELTSLPIVLVFNLLMLLLVLVSAFSMKRLLEKELDGLLPRIIPLTIIVYSFVLWWAAVFGEREHMIILAFLPMLTLRWLRWQGKGAGLVHAILIGLAVGIAVSLKPYFVALIVLSEVYWLVTRRDMRPLFQPEIFAFIFAGAAYVGHFWLVPTAMREAFFNDHIPRVVAGYDVYTTNPFPWLYISEAIPAVLLVGFAALLIKMREYERLMHYRRLLAISLFGSVFIYFYQNKGWLYQSIPAQLLALILIICMLTEFKQIRISSGRIKLKRYLLFAMLVSSLGAITFVHSYAGLVQHLYNTLKLENSQIFAVIEQYSDEGDFIGFIDPYIGADIYLLRTNRLPAMQYPIAFPLYFGLYRASEALDLYNPEENLPAEIRRYLTELEANIARVQPPVLFIRSDTLACNQCLQPFNVLRLLEAQGILDSEAMADYEAIGQLDAYTVYIHGL